VTIVNKTHKDNVLIFDHIPKCAGSSVQLIFRENYQHYFSLCTVTDWLEFKSWYQLNKKQSLFISGHQTWGIHELLDVHNKINYFTFLRHPFKLFVSTYTYYKAIHQIEDIPIEEYLLSYQHNPMCQHLGLGRLQSAKERLFEKYDSFGIVEYFDDSLKQLATCYGLSHLTMTSINQSPLKQIELPASLEFDFNERNQNDLNLYQDALNYFLKKRQRTNIDITYSIGNPIEKVTERDDEFDELIRTKDPMALHQLSKTKKLPGSHCHRIASLFEDQGNYELAEYWYLSIVEYSANNVTRLVRFYKDHYPEKLMPYIADFMVRLSVCESTIADSAFNVFKHQYLEYFYTLSQDNLSNVNEFKKIWHYCHSLSSNKTWFGKLNSLTDERHLENISCQNVLIIRSSKIVLANYIVQLLTSLADVHNIDVVIQKDMKTSLKDRVNHVFEIPSGRFQYHTIADHLIYQKRYNAIILLTAHNQLINDYRQYFELFNDLNYYKLYAFSLENIWQETDYVDELCTNKY
jgi:hypothetical protein